MPGGKPQKRSRRRKSNQRGPSGRDHSQPRGIADRLILEQAEHILPGNALLLQITGTALSRHLTQLRPDVRWDIFTCEHFYLTAIVNALSDVEGDETTGAEIELYCMPDIPSGEFDTVIFPTDAKGSSELTRDLLQSIAMQLKPAGRLIISTNNPRDHWLHEHLKEIFGRTTIVKHKEGMCYVARKGTGPKKLKSFRCEFAFRDDERLIRCVSRPGVFSHRRVDAGARALMRSLSLLTDDARFTRKPLRRIVEMGCGCGAVATAAALRYPDADVIAVDSHARAVQSAEQTAALNGAGNVSVVLTSDGNVPIPGTHDLFLCNPPYYSDFRISELFLQSAVEALRPGGRIHVVTKLTDWHENRMIEIFANAESHRFGTYNVVVSKLRH